MDETTVFQTPDFPTEPSAPEPESDRRPSTLLLALAAAIGVLGLLLSVFVVTSNEPDDQNPDAQAVPATAPATTDTEPADEDEPEPDPEPETEAPTPVVEPGDEGEGGAGDGGGGDGDGGGDDGADGGEPEGPAPAQLDVPSEVNLGMASSGSFDITNSGEEDLTVAFANVPGALTLSPVGGPIAGGDSVTVDVQVDKTGFPNGPYSLDFQVLSNGGDVTVDVNGTEAIIVLPMPEMSVPSEVDLGLANAGKFEIANTGTAILNVDVGAPLDAGVGVVGLGASVEPGETTEVTVNIDDDVLPGGPWQRTIVLTSNDGDAQVTIKGFKAVVADPDLFLPDMIYKP